MRHTEPAGLTTLAATLLVLPGWPAWSAATDFRRTPSELELGVPRLCGCDARDHEMGRIGRDPGITDRHYFSGHSRDFPGLRFRKPECRVHGRPPLCGGCFLQLPGPSPFDVLARTDH